MNTAPSKSGCSGEMRSPVDNCKREIHGCSGSSGGILGIDLGVGYFGSWYEGHGDLTAFDSPVDCVKKILALARKLDACIIAVENLGHGLNWRRRRTGKARWNYRPILRMLRMSGFALVEVDPAGTSQCCPRCGARFNEAALRDRLRGRKFMYCPDFDCGWRGHSDIAAARIIAARALDMVKAESKIPQL